MDLLNFPKPDLTIYLDLPVEEGLNRAKKRVNQIDLNKKI